MTPWGPRGHGVPGQALWGHGLGVVPCAWPPCPLVAAGHSWDSGWPGARGTLVGLHEDGDKEKGRRCHQRHPPAHSWGCSTPGHPKRSTAGGTLSPRSPHTAPWGPTNLPLLLHPAPSRGEGRGWHACLMAFLAPGSGAAAKPSTFRRLSRAACAGGWVGNLGNIPKAAKPKKQLENKLRGWRRPSVRTRPLGVALPQFTHPVCL